MNEYLLEQAKHYLSHALPASVKIGRTVIPDEPTKVNIEFYTESPLKRRENKDETKGNVASPIQAKREEFTATFTPSRILKSGNRTIVFWTDGTKTIVKRAEDEPDNDYAAFTAALGIKIFGSNSALRRVIKKNLKLQEKKK